VWAPAGAAFLLVRAGPDVDHMTVASAALQSIPVLLLAGGAAWAIVHPSRGIQDRLAGTWIVPR
jgi:hypothetical protein